MYFRNLKPLVKNNFFDSDSTSNSQMNNFNFSYWFDFGDNDRI